jgi:hypothetical protein
MKKKIKRFFSRIQKELKELGINAGYAMKC